jgi:hypothetical protein
LGVNGILEYEVPEEEEREILTCRSRKGYSVNAQETRKAQEREPYQEREQ